MPRRVIFHWQNASHRGYGRTLGSWLFSEAANQAWSIADSMLSLQAFLRSGCLFGSFCIASAELVLMSADQLILNVAVVRSTSLVIAGFSALEMVFIFRSDLDRSSTD